MVSSSAPSSLNTTSSMEASRKHRRRRMNDNSQQQYQSASEDDTLSVDSVISKKKRRPKKKAIKGGDSILWTVLVIGLVFCLADVLYIIGFVERFELVPKGPMNSANNKKQPDSEKQVQRTTKSTQKDIQKLVASGELTEDKEPILSLIERAGVKLDVQKDAELIAELPTWSEVVDLYGDKPVIQGLEMCEPFQNHSDKADHFVSTAGTFNSGTNLMAELLIANCHMQDRMDKYGRINRGVRWQVPWGKHTPPGDDEYRQKHKTDKDKNIDANNILPAVTIRDPLVWLKSMCRHHYAARWPHTNDRCPDFSRDNLKAVVHYAEITKFHDSILHHWNDYYTEYNTANFPHLLVRFEDLIFHPEEVTKQVCKCAGGSMRKDGKFIYIVDSAKKGKTAHGSVRTGYIDAIVKYGSAKHRYELYKDKQDLEYVRDNVDPTLMEMLKYPSIDPDALFGIDQATS